MTDLTLEDLASGGSDSGAGDSGGSDGSSESFLDLVQYLDESGYLGPIMFGKDALGDDSGGIDMDDDPETTETGELTLNAENIARFGSEVVDNIGDVPLSRVVQFAENNPDRINAAVEDLKADE